MYLPSLIMLLKGWLRVGSSWSSSGIPVSKYSTALSGLLKLALSALSTWFLQKTNTLIVYTSYTIWS